MPQIMAAFTTLCCFNSPSALSTHHILKQKGRSPPHQMPILSQKQIAPTSLRDVCKLGSLREAFKFLSFLFRENCPPNFSPDDVYSPVLELCASTNALSQGKQLHAHMIKSNVLSESVFLGTKLVFMYGKCGSSTSGQKMFDRMSHRTIFTWNAMIGACVSNGEPILALEFYQDMRFRGVPLDACTFPCLLKACGMLKDIYCGTEIHGLAIKYGYDSIKFIANALIAMYAKFYDLVKARQVFDGMKEKDDVVSWNSIISACVLNEQTIEALGLFSGMQKLGLATNSYTFVAALQACENSSFRNPGREIHAATVKYNYDLDPHVANALISMYVKCGELDEAVRVFNKLDERDRISWNTLLSGFVQHGLHWEALGFFTNMRSSGQYPDKVSIISILSACGGLRNPLSGKEVHAYAIKMGFDSDLHVGNTVIDMYSKCCCIEYMGRAFRKMPDKDYVTWTTVISGYAQNNFNDKAIELFRKVQIETAYIDWMMMGSVLQACGQLKSINYVKEIHACVLRKDLCDLVTQNETVNAYGQCGNVDYATRMFKSIESKDVVTWTSMICCYVRNGLASEALEVFQKMNRSGIETDAIALVSIISAAASLSVLNKGKEIHGFLIRKGFVLEGSLANSLVDMYSRCGTLDNAYKIFKCVGQKSLVLWTSMISANGMHGCGRAAIDLFYRMRDEGIIPDHITFLALLYACSHTGLLSEAKKFLEIMKCEYHLEPWPEHYACLVDLLGRANCLEEAYQFVLSDTEPTSEVWCALLRGCLVYSNKELGQIAAQKLLELDPEGPGNYVLVSNMFAASGRWKDVERVRMQMKAIGMKKDPGCSWIEVRNKVHTFMARDKSHPQSNEIYKKLSEVTEKLKRDGGYVPQTKFVLHDVEEEVKVEMLYGHSERLAIAYGLLKTSAGSSIRITKNLRVCDDCHDYCKLVSKFYQRELVIRDANRFHHFKFGQCSCGDFW